MTKLIDWISMQQKNYGYQFFNNLILSLNGYSNKIKFLLFIYTCNRDDIKQI